MSAGPRRHPAAGTIRAHWAPGGAAPPTPGVREYDINPGTPKSHHSMGPLQGDPVKPTDADELWTCPDCAFTFTAEHENTDTVERDALRGQPETERVRWYDAVSQQLAVRTPGGSTTVNGAFCKDGQITLAKMVSDAQHRLVCQVDADGKVEVLKSVEPETDWGVLIAEACLEWNLRSNTEPHDAGLEDRTYLTWVEEAKDRTVELCERARKAGWAP